MTKAVPMKLPADFTWVEATADDTWAGARLMIEGCRVLEIHPCRDGWLVSVRLHDPLNPQANVAVRSVAAGMRWAARWARSRIARLRVLAAGERRHAVAVAPMPLPIPASATVAPRSPSIQELADA
ncbi:hypothetical protein [Pseudoxanthomonas sp. z9]|uniref:hypothetical protein n=1 Tax=Pseudoxanthomonas sp. z9 TaxID=2584942 RepID=UPI001141A311|nr:hypothetical protein [Pseudoxanthomonas sp. z9]